MTDHTDVYEELATALREGGTNPRSDEQLLQHIVEQARMRPPVVRSARGTKRRVLLAALATLLLASSAVAVAQPAVRRVLFGDDPHTPANHVDALQHPENAVNMDVFANEGPGSTPDQQLIAMLHAGLMFKGTRWGTPLPGYARILVSRAGPEGSFRLAAMPTTRGNLCIAYTAVSQSGGGCIRRLDSSTPVNVLGAGRQGRGIIFGAAMDGVTAVTIHLTDGSEQRASMGRNAYVWFGPMSARAASVTATMRDGTEVTVDGP